MMDEEEEEHRKCQVREENGKLDTNNLDTNIRDFFQSDGTRPSVVVQRHFSPSFLGGSGV